MDWLTAFQLLGLAFLFGMSAFFSSAESALFSLNPLWIHRLRETHPRAARRLENVLADPNGLLSTILVGNTLVNVTIAGLGFMIFERFLPAYAVAASIPTMTVLLLILAEITPKRLALHKPESMAMRYAAPLLFLVVAMKPVTAPFRWMTRRLKGTAAGGAPRLTEEEFRTALGEGEAHGILDPEERTMVEGIIRLEGIRASDVMTPRVDVEGVDQEAPPTEIEATARRAGFKYLPLYRESIDRIEGFLDVRKFLLMPNRDVAAATIAPLFVPETMPLDALLTTFRRQKQRIACAKDEFGGTAGIVTQGDVLEEIIADVDTHRRTTTFKALAPNQWLVTGDVSLEDINYTLGLELEADDVDRMGGWIGTQLERMPRAGDVVETPACRVVVRKVRHERVIEAVLTRLPAPAEEASA